MSGTQRSGGFLLRLVRLVEANWAVLAILTGWQLWVWAGHVSPIVAPSPLGVAAAVAANWKVMLTAFGQTVGTAFLGFLVGTALGYGLALLSWSSGFVAGMLLPGSMLAQSIPVAAMVPVIARVVGYDVKAVIAIAILISFFPTYVLVRAGLERTPPGAQDLFTTLGATRSRRLLSLAIPSAMPSLLTAVRLSVANSMLAALTAEFLMGTGGLGFLIESSAPRMDLRTGWGAAILAMLVSVAMFAATSAAEQKWQQRWT